MARRPPAQSSTLCELCHSPAHVLCPSDDAFLCLRCDSMVHGANFLVGRHRRTYLCSCCCCPTTMVASGAFLPSRNQLCAWCSAILPKKAGCGTESGSFDSECSMLTCESDADSVPSMGSCSSESIRGRFTDRRKRPLELQVRGEDLDVLQDSCTSDGSFGEDDESSASSGFDTSSSSTSYIRNMTPRNSGAHGRQGSGIYRA